MAETEYRVAFALDGKREGVEITPATSVFDEEAFNRAVEMGTRVWADVPDIGQWVAEQRGAA